MTVCTVMLTYEVYEGSLGTYGPLPLLSWTIYISGLSVEQCRCIRKCFPELQDGIGGTLTISKSDKQGTGLLNLVTTMSTATMFLGWLDGEGFRVAGATVDSSVYSGGVTKNCIWTLQAP